MDTATAPQPTSPAPTRAAPPAPAARARWRERVLAGWCALVVHLQMLARTRLAQAKTSEKGQVAEWVVLTILGVGLAVAVFVVFRAKIMEAINSLNFTTGP